MNDSDICRYCDKQMADKYDHMCLMFDLPEAHVSNERYAIIDVKFSRWLWRLTRDGNRGYVVGATMGCDDLALEVASRAADEEMEWLLADAKAEFGL